MLGSNNLQFLIQDRFSLFAVPVVLCGFVQLAGAPEAGLTLGLPVGHCTAAVKSLLQDIRNLFSSSPSSSSSSSGTGDNSNSNSSSSHETGEGRGRTSIDLDSLVLDWKPIVLHSLVHRDVHHFASNFICYAQAISAMKFPSFAVKPGFPRGTFLSCLLASGAFVGALCLDAAARRDTKKVKQDYKESYYGFDFVGWLAGKTHEQKLSHTMMVGASGSVMCLVGYNCTFSPSIPTVALAFMSIANDVFKEVSRVRQLKQEAWAMQDVVAHSAHIGSFVYGCFIGALLRWLEMRRLNRLLHIQLDDDDDDYNSGNGAVDNNNNNNNSGVTRAALRAAEERATNFPGRGRSLGNRH